MVQGDKMRKTILLSWLLDYKLYMLNDKDREISMSEKPQVDRRAEYHIIEK